MFGSAIGATAAWLVYLFLAYVARKPAGRRILEYHIRGLAGVHDQLIAYENTRLREALDSWGAIAGLSAATQTSRRCCST